jgi:hypothetical protein
VRGSRPLAAPPACLDIGAQRPNRGTIHYGSASTHRAATPVTAKSETPRFSQNNPGADKDRPEAPPQFYATRFSAIRRRRMRAWTLRAVAALFVAIMTGCASNSYTTRTTVLRAADGHLWLYAEEIPSFRCERGMLVCSDSLGRRSQRLCRCVE